MNMNSSIHQMKMKMEILNESMNERKFVTLNFHLIHILLTV